MKIYYTVALSSALSRQPISYSSSTAISPEFFADNNAIRNKRSSSLDAIFAVSLVTAFMLGVFIGMIRK